MTDSIQTMGMLAAVLTTGAFLPQLLRAWRQGANDLSYLMLALYLLGVTLWLVYGIFMHSTPLILANGLTAVQVLALIVLKMTRRPGRVKVEEA